jgi:hypothetical protein
MVGAEKKESKVKDAAIYPASRIKRKRRTAAEIGELKDLIIEILEENRPMTIRQLFYQLAAVHQVIEKTEREYENVAVRMTGQLRMDGEIPFEWIADNTRWMRKPKTYSDLEGALDWTRSTYRKALWGEQGVRVEIWCEKDALAGILLEETAAWDVPLMVSRGFSSTSFLASAVQEIISQGDTAYLYYFGDHDPSGVAIDKAIRNKLREIGTLYRRQSHVVPEIHFKRVSVTEEQIEEWSLPTRPTKKSDSRSGTFRGDSVELDAVPKDKLLGLVEDCIVGHIDGDTWNAARDVEKAERETLETVLRHWPRMERYARTLEAAS